MYGVIPPTVQIYTNHYYLSYINISIYEFKLICLIYIKFISIMTAETHF